jgi:geranylgeranyl diphosphate synthase type I
MTFEGRQEISVTMYLTMIERKTAALMACALEMGARVGGADDTLAHQLGEFGRALGMAFQLRDDLLGIWANFAQLGKSQAGDLRRKKMSLPVIHALEHATIADREMLLGLYAADGPASDQQVTLALAILERTGAQARVRSVLNEQCERAQALLGACTGPTTIDSEPHACLSTLIEFVAHTV